MKTGIKAVLQLLQYRLAARDFFFECTRFRAELEPDGLGRKTIKNSVRTMF
jgi:hypothetical protein